MNMYKVATGICFNFAMQIHGKKNKSVVLGPMLLLCGSQWQQRLTGSGPKRWSI